jgi:hypothetical protein
VSRPPRRQSGTGLTKETCSLIQRKASTSLYG